MTKKATSLFQSRGEQKPLNIKQMANAIEETFAGFDVPIEIVESIDGYRSFHFHIRPTKPMRMKAFSGFVDDLKYALSNDAVEIEAPIPNKKLVGITVTKQEDLPPIPYKDALKWDEFRDSSELVVPIGIDEFGNRHLLDIARTPHMLAAGTTGSGKSVFVHAIINALLEKNTPDQLRFMFIDPKRIELTLYAGLPHLLTPPVTEAKKTVRALTWAVKEMERRYDILEAERVQNISAYHKHVYQPSLEKRKKADSKEVDRTDLPESMPFIVIIIDELNDIMQAYPQEMEALVIRLAQMSRAVGIHLILTTQRPSTNVITGSIKANIPTRVAFTVASQIDSRTILDTVGAEKLQGEGDLLYMSPEDWRATRIQGLYLSEEEVRERVKKLKESAVIPEVEPLDLSKPASFYSPEFFSSDLDGEEDDLYEDAKQAVIEAGKATTSYLQRKLRIGYSRAARLMDLLEEGGVIGPQVGSSPRKILE